MNATYESPVTYEMITDLGAAIGAPQDSFTVARKVAKILDVPIARIIGVKDTLEKLLCIYVEVVASPDVCPKYLAKKYSIYMPYMQNRLKQICDGFYTDGILKAKIIALNEAFFN